MMEYFVIYGVLAYLIGSIPTAVWLGRAKYGIDVREHGSKNAGATNTFRVLGKRPGITVLLIDIIKGFIAVTLPYVSFIGKWGTSELIHVQLLAALLAVLGHVFPVFVGFKGGKGVATSLGVIIGVHPPAAGICFLVFLVVFMATQFVSLGAIFASVAFPILVILVFGSDSLWLSGFSILLSTAVLFSHRKNMRRLLDGQENKMNLFKK